MHLTLLKNENDFKTWREDRVCSGDTADLPAEFPCYVRMVVASWVDEAEEAMYLYKTDLEIMLSDMEEKCHTSILTEEKN